MTRLTRELARSSEVTVSEGNRKIVIGFNMFSEMNINSLMVGVQIYKKLLDHGDTVNS